MRILHRLGGKQSVHGLMMVAIALALVPKASSRPSPLRRCHTMAAPRVAKTTPRTLVPERSQAATRPVPLGRPRRARLALLA